MSIPQNTIKTDELWFKEISQLYRVDRLTEFFPRISQTQEERLNSIARLGIYAGILLALYKRDYRQLLLSVVILAFTLFVYKRQQTRESMTNEEKKEQPRPTLNNPFMNPNITNFGVKPIKESVPDYSQDTKEAQTLREEVEDKFNYNLYKSIDDVYDTMHGRRDFYTVPNTEVPSNQDKFLEFLYGDMKKNCKSDTTVCEPYSDLRANPFIFPNPKDNPIVSGEVLAK